jgi:hypothetical protein
LTILSKHGLQRLVALSGHASAVMSSIQTAMIMQMLFQGAQLGWLSKGSWLTTWYKETVQVENTSMIPAGS